MKSLVLKRGRSGPNYGRHPWVFEKAIDEVRGEPVCGDEVSIFSESNELLGVGLFNPASEIRARIYSFFEPASLDESFFEVLLLKAIQRRKSVTIDGDVVRWVFSEADDLSGLIVDQFGELVVVVFNSAALFLQQQALIAAIKKHLKPRWIYVRFDLSIQKKEGFEAKSYWIDDRTPGDLIVATERGLKFLIDPQLSQKTGFYADQRENRQKVARFANQRSVLDLFCYTGGFGISAAKAGASSVCFVDRSEPAIETAKKNVELNGVSSISSFICQPADEYFESSQESYGLVVADPPKLASSRRDKRHALRAYFAVNSNAMACVSPDGIYASFSCSAQITRDDLQEVVAAVARRARRSVQIIEDLGQPADHPVLLSCTETRYLKGLLCRIQ